MQEDNKHLAISHLPIIKGHWANRDFAEYGNVVWFYSCLLISLKSCIFLVRGIVDKINDMINNKVIITRLQNVRLDSSNSPNETVRYEFNFK